VTIPLDSGPEKEIPNPWNKPELCQNCTLYLEPGPVLGEGDRNTKILFVGETPNADAVDYPNYRPDRFHPYAGGLGRIRSALFKGAALDKKDLFSTHCVKCYPPKGRNPTELEVACCASFLIEEIESINPNVVIAAGELALNVLTGKKKIGLFRGVPTEGPSLRKTEHTEPDLGLVRGGPDLLPYKVFPTWNPKAVVVQQWNWPFAVHDLVRAKAESTTPEINRVPYNIVRVAHTDPDAGPMLSDIRARGAATFDFETTGLSPQHDSIHLCGIASGTDQAHVYSWSDRTKQLLQTLFDDPKIEVCGQNILSFDLPFFEAKGGIVDYAKIFDTMVAFHLCNSSYGQTSISEQNAGSYTARGTEKDLSFIASNHTDMEYWKSRDSYKSDIRLVCGLDCIATDRAAYAPHTGLKAELERYGMTSLYYDHVLPVHPVMANMTRHGVLIDGERAMLWGYLLQKNAEEKEVQLKEGLGDPHLNINSSPQLMTLLYDKLGLPVQWNNDKKRGRTRTANAEALERLAQLAPENVILREIVAVRHLRKMNSTYIQPGLEAPDGHLHPRFGVSKTSNGRFNGFAPNAQNVPEQMRDIWIPDSSDYVLLSADASQIEWRAAMVLSGDPVGLGLLASGVDNHRAVSAETLGKAIEKVTDEERHAAKFIVYGLGYGRGADSIAKGHNLDISFVNKFIKRFFDRFHVFRDWRNNLPIIVKDQYYLSNPWGRRRWWYTRNITEIYNFPASSCAADMMIDELIALDKQLPHGATLRLTVHDEVVINALKENIKDVYACVKDIMEMKWPKMVEASARPEIVKQYYPDGWFCPVDIGIGTNWKMTKSKDPDDKIARDILAKKLGL